MAKTLTPARDAALQLSAAFRATYKVGADPASFDGVKARVVPRALEAINLALADELDADTPVEQVMGALEQALITAAASFVRTIASKTGAPEMLLARGVALDLHNGLLDQMQRPNAQTVRVDQTSAHPKGRA